MPIGRLPDQAPAPELFDDLKAAGFHPFQAPCGVMLNEQDMAESECIRCQTCDGFPCLVDAKSEAETLGVRPALALVMLAKGRRCGARREHPKSSSKHPGQTGQHLKQPSRIAQIQRPLGTSVS